MKTRLTWNGSNEAQRQADEAFARLKASQARKPAKGRRRAGKRRRQRRYRTYAEYIQSAEWRTKRQEALTVHGTKCGVCGSTDRLEVHHLHYRTLFRESARDDLRVLCRDCHALTHEDQGAVDALSAAFRQMVREF